MPNSLVISHLTTNYTFPARIKAGSRDSRRLLIHVECTWVNAGNSSVSWTVALLGHPHTSNRETFTEVVMNRH